MTAKKQQKTRKTKPKASGRTKTAKKETKRRTADKKRDLLPGFEVLLAGSPDVRLEDISVTARQIAALYGVSTQAVHKWRDRGAPSEKNGKAVEFPLVKLIQWRRARDREEAAGALDEDEKGTTPWDIQLKKWKAQRAKLEFDREIGKLVPREKVRRDLYRCVAALSQELEAVGKSHGSSVQNDISDAVDRFLTEIGVDDDSDKN